MNASPLSAVTGAVLAGGRSSRFGRDKALEVVGGATLLERALAALAGCGERLVVGGSDALYGFAGVPVAPDVVPGRGPLGGLETALAVATFPRVALTACDMPGLTPGFWAFLAGLDGEAVVPEGPDGRLEPLAGLYVRSCLDAVRGELGAGHYKLSGAWLARRARVVPWAEVCGRFGEGVFRNVNRESDLDGL